MKKYYLQQLNQLREMGHAFAQAHPAIAPLLSGASNDPDVERLLQGVAFLTGLIRQKLDDEFPEIIHSLLDIVFPYYLRPLPAASIVQFTSKPNVSESVFIPAGTSIASLPVEGIECLFSTCFDTEVHPLEIRHANFHQQPGKSDSLVLSLQLKSTDLSQWKPRVLPFYPGETFDQGAFLFMLLTRHLTGIELKPISSGKSCLLPPEALHAIGFHHRNSLLPYPTQSFSGYRYLQEYFHLPQKYLFLELTGWEKWEDRGSGTTFEIIFHLKDINFPLPPMSARKFILFATPVVNLFPRDADPVLYDHHTEKVPLQPSGARGKGFQIYSVDSVVGFQQGSVARREYRPLQLSNLEDKEQPIYQLIHALSPLDQSVELFLTFPYQGDQLPSEILSINMTCTNGKLTDSLRPGDICRSTYDTPDMVIPASIMSPTASVDPPLGDNALWKFLSHLSLNFFTNASRETLQSVLNLYLYPEGRDKTKIATNQRRIEGIKEVTVTPLDRMFKGAIIRGFMVELTADRDHFANTGDLVLFGAVLDLYLGTCVAMNSFVQFKLKDKFTGDNYLWPPRFGGNRTI